MVTKFDNFFESLIGDQGHKFVNTYENRFKWCFGYAKNEKGKYYSFQHHNPDIRMRRVFEYMVDTATDKIYKARNHAEMGQSFFAVLSIPVIWAGSVMYQVVKLVTEYIKVVFDTFSDVFEHINDTDIAPLISKSFDENLTKRQEKIFEYVKGISNSCKYASGLVVAALYGMIYANDLPTVCKMQTIFAELEKQWNKEISFKKSFYSFAVRYQRNPERFSFGEVNPDSTNPKINLLDEIKPVLYTLQCYQERDSATTELMENRYTSYQQMLIESRTSEIEEIRRRQQELQNSG